MRANLSFQSRKTMRNAERERTRRMSSIVWKNAAGRWRSNLALNVFETVDEAVMGEDDFGGNISNVRFIDKIAARDFADEFVWVAASELNVHIVSPIDVTDADHAALDLDEEIAVALPPAAGEIQLITPYNLPVGVDCDFDSKTLSEYFWHPRIRSVSPLFFKHKPVAKPAFAPFRSTVKHGFFKTILENPSRAVIFQSRF